jgi:hypothetical protein
MTLLPVRRMAVLAAGLGLGLSAWIVMRLVAPTTEPVVIAFMPLICCGVLAATLDDRGMAGFAPIILCCAIGALLAAFAIYDPKQMALLFGFGSLGLMLAGGYSLAKAARWRSLSHNRGNWTIGLTLVAALSLFCIYYIATSQDLMFGDFMYRRVEAVIIAAIIDAGQFATLAKAFVGSMKDEYSLLPALAPGVALSVALPLSRAWYQAAIIVFYAAPAYFALGVLARDLARRANPRRSATVGQPAALALAVSAAFAAYPTGMAVAARGMPDIGGLVLVVASLRLSERLARLLALPRGHEARIGRLTRRVTLALALSLFGMFLFRRWYAFAAVGIATMLVLEVALLAAMRGAEFRWREAISAAALGALILLALGSPVLFDWLRDPDAHDYATIYAAYRKEFPVFVAEIFDWYGAALLVGAVCCAIFLATRPGDRRLLRLTFGSTIVAALLFLRIQSPAIHHAYLLTPAFAGAIGAAILISFERRTLDALAVVVGLAAVTLTPMISSWTPVGFAPTAGQPPAPRSDLAELARLKAWVKANATSDRRYCVLASSYTINDVLVEQLWQLDPEDSPVITDASLRTDIGMPHVDTRDGPPVKELKDCANILVGDPVQTHLVLAYQQNVIVPASEMLAGIGIGASYRRSGEVFSLEKGVKLVVFERVLPLEDSDIAALQARWRAAREKNAARLRGTSAD